MGPRKGIVFRTVIGESPSSLRTNDAPLTCDTQMRAFSASDSMPAAAASAAGWSSKNWSAPLKMMASYLRPLAASSANETSSNSAPLSPCARFARSTIRELTSMPR